MKREEMLSRVKSRAKPWDIVVIGGGAVGAGVALPRPYDSHRQFRNDDHRRRKWTTYRHMAEDCVDHAITLGNLSDTPCITADLRIHGYHPNPKELGALGVYGTDAEGIRGIVRENAAFGETLHPKLPYIAAEVVWSVRHEMSRTLDDALARRTRALLLNARAAMAIGPKVARLVAAELGRDEQWIAGQVERFTALAGQYTLAHAKSAVGGLV